MAVFMAITLIDIIRNFIPKIRSSYDISLYIGILFPNILAFVIFVISALSILIGLSCPL